MNGKEKCKILKKIRKEIVKQNDIDIIISDCKYQGDCRGTCPKCDSELQFIEEALANKRKAGLTVSIASLAVASSVILGGCDGIGTHQTQGVAADPNAGLEIRSTIDPTYETQGDIALEKPDLSSELTIKGSRISLPCTLAKFTELTGYAIDKERESESVDAFMPCDIIELSDGTDIIKVDLYNNSDKTVAITDTYIASISFTDRYSQNLDVKLYGDIFFNSSIDDVNSVFGEPDEKNSTDTSTDYTYTYEDSSILFYFNENGAINNIFINYFSSKRPFIQ